MRNPIYISNIVIQGVELDDWLECTNRFSRYSIKNQPEQSVWVCTDCDHLAEDCQCGDDLAENLDIA